MTSVGKCWVLWSVPSSCGRKWRDHVKPWGSTEVRGKESSAAAPVLPSLSPTWKLNSSIASFPGSGHAMALPSQLGCVDLFPALQRPHSETEPCNRSQEPALREERHTTRQQVRAPGDSQEVQALPKLSCIQLWHAAVANYSAVQPLPLWGRAGDSFMGQIIETFQIIGTFQILLPTGVIVVPNGVH